MNGGLRPKALGTKAQRQESARQGIGGTKNVKKSGDPVTLPPSAAKLHASENGSKSPRKAR